MARRCPGSPRKAILPRRQPELTASGRCAAHYRHAQRHHLPCSEPRTAAERSGPTRSRDRVAGGAVHGAAPTVAGTVSPKNRLIRSGMQAVLRLSAWLARSPSRAGASRALMRGLADATVRSKGIRPATTLAELGAAWQRGFPSRKQVPITAVTDTTVYAEIHTPCPLRGSGDLQACHRMMEYDRRILEHAGGQFFVLDSQAAPGRSYCRVAMRRAGAASDDLDEAHRRPGPPNGSSRMQLGGAD